MPLIGKQFRPGLQRSLRFQMDSGVRHVPVLHLKFGENSGDEAKDSSPEGNNGTIYGASWVKGYLGPGLSFDGVDDYANCGVPGAIEPENITVVLWIYCYRWIGQVTEFPLHHVYPSADGLGIITNINNWGWWIKTVAGRQFRDTSHENRLNEWHHLVLSYGKALGDMKFYWNGVLKDTYNLGVGAAIVWGGGYFRLSEPTSFTSHSIIDEVRVYDRALTAREIRELYYGIE